MGDNAKNYGGGSATPVGNNWMQLLNSGLNGPGGQFSNPTGQSGQINPSSLFPNGASRPIAPSSSSNPSGGMGTPGAAPGAATAQTGGMAGYINNQLNSNPSQMTYSNPNNPVPQGYTPTQIGQQQVQQYSLPTIQNPGASSTFNSAQNAQMQLANGLSSGLGSGQNQGTNPNSIGAPGAPGVQAFSSNGILGPESNVATAITNAANLQNSQALAAQNARFTQSGGMSGGTPAAYATAQTQAQANTALANSLAQSDINYRNLDLGAYQAQNQAQQQQFGTQANIYGTQQNALGNYNQLGLGYGTLGLNAASAAGNILGNVSNQQANQQQIGFNYDQLGQQGQIANNQLNLNSALGFGQLNNQAQQYNNQNAATSTGLAQQQYGTQGQLDLSTQGQAYNQQQNLINQLFGSYNNAANIGIPHAGTSITPNTGQNLLNAIPGIASSAVSLAPLLNQSGQPGAGNTNIQYQQPQNINMPGTINTQFGQNTQLPYYG